MDELKPIANLIVPILGTMTMWTIPPFACAGVGPVKAEETTKILKDAFHTVMPFTLARARTRCCQVAW